MTTDLKPHNGITVLKYRSLSDLQIFAARMGVRLHETSVSFSLRIYDENGNTWQYKVFTHL